MIIVDVIVKAIVLLGGKMKNRDDVELRTLEKTTEK